MRTNTNNALNMLKPTSLAFAFMCSLDCAGRCVTNSTTFRPSCDSTTKGLSVLSNLFCLSRDSLLRCFGLGGWPKCCNYVRSDATTIDCAQATPPLVCTTESNFNSYAPPTNAIDTISTAHAPLLSATALVAASLALTFQSF